MLFIYGRASSDLEALRQYADRSHQQNWVSWPLILLGVKNIYEAKFSLRVWSLEENRSSGPVTQYKKTRTQNSESCLKSNCSSLACLTLTRVLSLSEAPCLLSNTGITNICIVYRFVVKTMRKTKNKKQSVPYDVYSCQFMLLFYS